MKRLVLLFTLLFCSSFSLAADQAPGCGPGPDLSKAVAYYTASDGSFVTLEIQPASTELVSGVSRVETSAADQSQSFNVPEGMVLVATTWCGGTKDCSSKACSSPNRSCRGCTMGCCCQ